MDWNKLLSETRRRPTQQSTHTTSTPEFRTQLERDYDRILFSTPVRRLADKTQVFPLERNDSVRTRLTHSHEVSNLCRSLGTHLAHADFLADPRSRRNLPAVLAAIGLAHDLGNPPFGHQGEQAIQSWFLKRGVLEGCGLTKAQEQDFLKFEGNAQTMRILTRLQLRNDDYGLNLTYATLAAIMKYPTPSDAVAKSHVATKKHGFFQSEAKIVREIWEHTGLGLGVRHPLTYLMEACDDIAYTVLDAEDAVKKGLVSFSDLVGYLTHHASDDPMVRNVVDLAKADHTSHQRIRLSPAELNDLSMLMFRVHAIAAMIPAVYEAFMENRAALESGKLADDLLAASHAGQLRDTLKAFDALHAYRHKSVLALEAQGFQTIHCLMDLLWMAIRTREFEEKVDSPRSTPFARYAYQCISENYRRIFEDPTNTMPPRYREAQLLTDTISGMTDSFAVSLCAELGRYESEAGKR
jgi:dGTPase